MIEECVQPFSSLSELHTFLMHDKFHVSKSIFQRNLAARTAVIYPFMLEGIFMGVWSAYLPNIEDSLHLSDSQLGVAVLCVYLATVMATPLSAFCIRHLGSKYATLLGKVTFGLSLPLIALSNSFGVLVAAMFTFGFTMGIMDVSMNSCAILTEIVAGIPLMGSFHGSYSVAAAIGSLMGGSFVQNNYSTLFVFLILSSASVLLSTLSSFNMYSLAQEKAISAFNAEQDKEAVLQQIHEEEDAYSRIPQSTDEEDVMAKDSRWASRPAIDDPLIKKGGEEFGAESAAIMKSSKHSIMFFCMVGFLAAFGESGIVTWSIVFFDRYLHTSSVLHSLGFTCFMVSMATGRFFCDYLRRMFGRRLMVRVGGLLAMAGLLLAVMSLSLPFPVVFACLGFVLAGLGLSTLIPIMFSSAGHLPGVHAGTSISIVAGFSYSGSIVSSPMIGFLSDLFGDLKYALLVDSFILGLIFLCSWGIPAEFAVQPDADDSQEKKST